MVAADKNTLVSYSARELLAYFVVGTLITIVVGDTLVESKDVLVCHGQAAIFDIGEPCAIWRKRMQHTLSGGVANMNCRVYAKRGALYTPGTFNYVSTTIRLFAVISDISRP